MKKRLLMAFVIVLALAVTASVVSAAVGTIQVWWYEDAQRYNADGTHHSSWTDDRIPPQGAIEFTKTGQAYHGGMEWFYNYYPLENFRASPLVISGGKFAAWARYTSPSSHLPILDKIRGRLTIDPDLGTAHGSYVQYGYVEGIEDEDTVKASYPHAVETDEPGVWLVGVTYYQVHGQSTQ